MLIVHHRLAGYLVEERRAQADRARLLAEFRRLRKARPQHNTATPSPETEVVELAFGCHCETEQIGA
jgi:hypothetical protein